MATPLFILKTPKNHKKMIKTISPSEPYDLSYQKETWLIFVGILLFLSNFIPASNAGGFSSAQMSLAIIGIRIFSVIVIRDVSEKQNRDTMWSSACAFVWPALTFVVMGCLQKKNLSFKIDDIYPSEQQRKELRKYAEKFIKKSRFDEAAFVYEYIVNSLPDNEQDKEQYEWVVLQQQAIKENPNKETSKSSVGL